MKYRKLTDINQAMTAFEDAMRQADLAFLDELERWQMPSAKRRWSVR